MNEMMIFEDVDFGKIRTVMIDGEPWFVGKDIALALGYKKPENALITHVDRDDTLKQGIIDSIGRRQMVTVINESGLYSLIMSSKLASAKKFKRWVTKEVLPSIRKHGAYATEELLNDPEFAIKVFERLRKEQQEKQMLISQIEENSSYTEFGKAIYNIESGLLVGQYAKLLKNDNIIIGQNRLFQWFRDNGYLMGSGDKRNVPYQKYIEMGLFQIKESPLGNIVITTLVTGKGQLFFIEKLKQEFGISIDDTPLKEHNMKRLRRIKHMFAVAGLVGDDIDLEDDMVKNIKVKIGLRHEIMAVKKYWELI